MTQTIKEILEERGNRYGSFDSHAKITQALKSAFKIYTPSSQYIKLTPSMLEAIDMIFHKLGRIANGDPTYLDSWIDIVGYTQLVIDELNAASSKK